MYVYDMKRPDPALSEKAMSALARHLSGHHRVPNRGRENWAV